jgi:acyl-coenzyme A synthetase/AMP-(fatty) acid ligase
VAVDDPHDPRRQGASRRPTGRTTPGFYTAGDGARRDKDGNFWIIGRLDDVLNVSGHRLGTAEIESALVAHPAVAEAAVVGRPDDLKGQAVAAFVTLKGGFDRVRGNCWKKIAQPCRQGDRSDRQAG